MIRLKILRFNSLEMYEYILHTQETTDFAKMFPKIFCYNFKDKKRQENEICFRVMRQKVPMDCIMRFEAKTSSGFIEMIKKSQLKHILQTTDDFNKASAGSLSSATCSTIHWNFVSKIKMSELTISWLLFSRLMIQFLPCPCGSMMSGYRAAFVTMMPFWIESSSFGKPCRFHSLIWK